MGQNYQVGQQHLITTESGCENAKILELEKYDDGKQQGTLAKCRLDIYGIANLYVPDGVVTDSQLLARQSMSGMPEQYVYKTGKDFNWSYYESSTEYAKKIPNAFVCKFSEYRKSGRGLYIFSKTKGSGKTMLACCIANEIAKRQDISVKFVNIPDYIELVKDKSETAKECVEKIREAGVLILDDVGTQVENKDWITTALFRLIDHRYTRHLPTIFTSNIPMEELKTDDRIADRIYEVSTPIMMPEENIRRKLADKHKKNFLQSVLNEEPEENIFAV